jgi:hypothetical protein
LTENFYVPYLTRISVIRKVGKEEENGEHFSLVYFISSLEVKATEKKGREVIK